MSKYVPVHSKSQRAPIDKLAWNARNSVTALDRAGITSPLVGHRRQYSSSNTFAPGGLDKYGIASVREHQFSARVTQTLVVPYHN